MILIIGMVFCAGCTQQQSTGVEKPAEPALKGTVAQVNSAAEYPAPPADNVVSAQINEKDQTDKSISVFFSGGKGQKMVRSAWVIMTRSDGKVEQVSLTPKAQSEVVLTGTDGDDLVKVYAEYYDGNIYQIAERTVKMRQRI